MYKVLVNIFVILFIHENCSHYIQIKKSVQDGVGSIIDKYIGPLRKLKADFPDHVFEVEMELHGIITHAPSKHQKVLRMHHKPVIVKAKLPIAKKKVVFKTEPNIYTTKTIPPSNYKKTVHSVETSTTTSTHDANDTTSKKPLYMEDLKKVLEDFEIKHLVKTTVTSGDCHLKHVLKSHQADEDFSDQASTIHSHGGFSQMENIMKLLQRGVQIQTHVPKPNEDNLDWLQIKIPKHI